MHIKLQSHPAASQLFYEAEEQVALLCPWPRYSFPYQQQLQAASLAALDSSGSSTHLLSSPLPTCYPPPVCQASCCHIWLPLQPPMAVISVASTSILQWAASSTAGELLGGAPGARSGPFVPWSILTSAGSLHRNTPVRKVPSSFPLRQTSNMSTSSRIGFRSPCPLANPRTVQVHFLQLGELVCGH